MAVALAKKNIRERKLVLPLEGTKKTCARTRHLDKAVPRGARKERGEKAQPPITGKEKRASMPQNFGSLLVRTIERDW